MKIGRRNEVGNESLEFKLAVSVALMIPVPVAVAIPGLDPVENHVAIGQRLMARYFDIEPVLKIGTAEFEHCARIVTKLCTNSELLLDGIEVADLTLDAHVHSCGIGVGYALDMRCLDTLLVTVMTDNTDNISSGKVFIVQVLEDGQLIERNRPAEHDELVIGQTYRTFGFREATDPVRNRILLPRPDRCRDCNNMTDTQVCQRGGRVIHRHRRRIAVEHHPVRDNTAETRDRAEGDEIRIARWLPVVHSTASVTASTATGG